MGVTLVLDVELSTPEVFVLDEAILADVVLEFDGSFGSVEWHCCGLSMKVDTLLLLSGLPWKI